jgi:hypothetical protein
VRRDTPSAQQKERTQRALEEQERHTIRIDRDGDVIMDEWTKCGFCLRMRLLLTKANVKSCRDSPIKIR